VQSTAARTKLTENSFEWTSQLQFGAHDTVVNVASGGAVGASAAAGGTDFGRCFILQNNASFDYGYEFQVTAAL
jgi:hypothetical protein